MAGIGRKSTRENAPETRLTRAAPGEPRSFSQWRCGCRPWEEIEIVGRKFDPLDMTGLLN
jgi:hypothetical protein